MAVLISADEANSTTLKTDDEQAYNSRTLLMHFMLFSLLTLHFGSACAHLLKYRIEKFFIIETCPDTDSCVQVCCKNKVFELAHYSPA